MKIFSLAVKALFIVIFCSIQTTADVKLSMDKFYVHLNDLQPYLAKKSKFVDESSKESVQSILAALASNVKELKSSKSTSGDSFRFRTQLLNEGLEEASTTYRDGFRDYAYWVTKASLTNCSSCHTEKGLPETKYKFDFDKSTSDFEKFDFLFMIRNYSESTKDFTKLVSEYPKNKIQLDELLVSVKKLVYYHMRVKRDDVALLKMIDTTLKNKELPLFLNRDLLQWKKYLEIKKYRVLPEAESFTSVKALNDFIEERDEIATHFGEGQQRFIVDQETLFFLYKNLEQAGLDQELRNLSFFWISKIQRAYRDSMFDNSAEIYLTECVRLTKVASTGRKCVDEFREQKLETFDTRQVTELPNKIRAQIDTMNDIVKKLEKKK